MYNRIQQIATLPPHTCLTIGETTRHYPLIIKTTPLPVKTAGETRKHFKEE